MQPQKPLSDNLSYLLKTLRIEVITDATSLTQSSELLKAHHYLGDLKAVGERLHYSIRDADGGWLGVMIFTSASRRLRHRDGWIGWTDEQRRRRLCLVVNNARFLLLPDRTVPNLGSAVLKRVCARLSADWEERYGHPVLVLETFVDPSRFSGTVYMASGWKELGLTRGNARKGRDYYEAHGQPKRLFVRELVGGGCRSLQAETLKPSLAQVDADAPKRCTQNSQELGSLKERFKQQVPEYHKQRCTYPVYALLSIIAAAHLAGAPRGQKDLAVFASSLSQTQRRALGIRRKAYGKHYPSPGQSTFSRMMSEVDIDSVETVLIQWQQEIRGEEPEDELVCLDGKIPKHSGGKNVLTASTSPGQHYLGCAIVKDKTNEIPAARELFGKLDLDGKLVSLDALHTQRQTARELVINHGADYVFTVKGNQPTLCAHIEQCLDDPAAPFLSPKTRPATSGSKAAKKVKTSPAH
jgi:hypothetical protein